MKLLIAKTLTILSFLIIASSCKKGDDNEPLEAEDHLDLAYGTHTQNTMDVYLPEDRSDTTKVIFLVHGGGWVSEDKDSLTETAIHFRDKGFAVVNLNYRLAGTPESNVHPAQVIDIATAVSFVAQHATDWRVSRDKFGIGGISAGAHLALLYTYAFNANGKIKAVVSLAGPTNLTDDTGVHPLQKAAVQTFIGSEFNATNLPLYIQASPLAKVSSLAKPTLLIHGTADATVPYKQSLDLHTKLNQLGVKNGLMELTTGHEIFDAGNTEDVLKAIEDWFNENIK
jgi:acetyl esterase/lipase